MNLSYLSSAVLSFLVTIFLVPFARRTAIRAGIVDQPDGQLKVHPMPIPYLGGLAMFLSFLVTIVTLGEPNREVLAIVIGGTLMIILGLLDDIGNFSPYLKLAGQILTVYVLIRLDIVVKFHLFPVWMNYAITLLWIVGLCNAVNLVDIMDGLAAGVGAISAGVLCVITYLNGQTSYGILAAALFGACLGFLIFNRPPASIYMGDAGSQFLGVTLGILGLLGDYSHYNFLAILNPLLIFFLPIFDTAYVILMRALSGHSIFRGSKDHLVVRLRLAGWPVPLIVSLMLTVHGLFAVMSIYNMYASPRFSIMLYIFVGIVAVSIGLWLARVPVWAGEAENPRFTGEGKT